MRPSVDGSLPASIPAPVPTPGSPEKQAVRAMFDRIAPRYDLLNRVLSAGTDVRWRRRAVDWLELSAPARVLDLCTGTADLLLEVLGRDRRHSGVGVDLSREMLSRGAGKIARAGAARRGFVAAGDAEILPVAEGAFDGALVAFGIRNVGDVPRAIREVHRALRPGARFVILEFSVPPGVFGRLYRLYFTKVLPRLGGLVSGDRSAYTYLPASVDRFPSPASLAVLMEEAGFTSVRWQLLTGGIACLHRGDKAT
jgi:demethylmenaquinone methyltransferase/2-methoxy-6-polyprenyl-1,4-benzoquinol methylase